MSIGSSSTPAPVYTDLGGLTALRAQAAQDPNASLEEVAKHLESMFLQMMLSSMRDASLADGPFDSDQMRTYRDMYDRQLGLELASNQGLGLATVLLRQLGGEQQSVEAPDAAQKDANGGVAGNPATVAPGRGLAITPAATLHIAATAKPQGAIAPAATAANASAVTASPSVTGPSGSGAIDGDAQDGVETTPRTDSGPMQRPVLPSAAEAALAGAVAAIAPKQTADGATAGSPERAFTSPQDFVQRLWPHAQAAGAAIGAPPGALIAQAALETGWGRSVPNTSDGVSSYNLFGIKADSRWEGPRVTHQTTEVRDGVFVREPHRFRVYSSFEESFSDYARFLQENPRYTEALRHTANPERFFTELQSAGYATDPGYAAKLNSVYGRVDATGSG